MSQYLYLARQGRFRVLLAGQVLSLLGDALFPMIVVTAIANHASGFSVAVIFAARAVALGALVLFAGGLVDRVNPVHAILAVNAIRFCGLAFRAVDKSESRQICR